MYAIDRGLAGNDRLPVAVLKTGTEAFELPPAAELARRHGERWTVIDTHGGGAFRARPAPCLVFLGRRGPVTVVADGLAATLEPGRFVVTEHGARVEVTAGRDAAWLAIALPSRAAARIAHAVHGAAPAAEPGVFADDGEGAALVTADELAQLEHALAGGTRDWVLAEIAAAIVARLIERQGAHAEALARTCGRTERHRRHLYARLNRVRRLVARAPVRDYSMRELAAVAHLSVWHFVRSFGQVFGETPHRFLTRLRLESAARMLAHGDEAIAFVAERHGFENRCAFARLFRTHFGQPASQYRRAQRAAQATRAPLRVVRIDAATAATGVAAP